MAVRVKKNRHNPRVAAVIIVVLALIILSAVMMFRDSAGISIASSKHITIAENATVSQLADQLKQEGIIKYKSVFKAKASLGGYEGNFKSGGATILAGMSYDDILDLLVTPGREMVKIVIPKGSEARDIAEKLEEADLISAEEFLNELKKPEEYDYRFLADITDREYPLEGYLYPATYEIPTGMSAGDIVDLMLEAFDNQFKDEYYEKAAQYSMSIDQVIAMASIIERETGNDEEKANVAGVFYNRKNAGMKLQSGATVQYVLKEKKPQLSKNDLKIDSKYNTFVYAGLPIGPICNPGIESIQAALEPAVHYYNYHASTEDGEDIYSETKDGFIADINGKNLNITFDEGVIE